jgi:hypothetical protein
VAALSRPSRLLPLVNGSGSTRDSRPSNSIRIDSVVFCAGCRLILRYPIDDQWRSGSCMRRHLRRTGHDAFFYLGLAWECDLGLYRTHYDGHVPRNHSVLLLNTTFEGRQAFTAPHIEDHPKFVFSFSFAPGVCFRQKWTAQTISLRIFLLLS